MAQIIYPCHSDHAVLTPAVMEITLYERHEDAIPTPVWRGYCCQPCTETGVAMLKRQLAGARSLLLLLPVRQ